VHKIQCKRITSAKTTVLNINKKTCWQCRTIYRIKYWGCL